MIKLLLCLHLCYSHFDNDNDEGNTDEYVNYNSVRRHEMHEDEYGLLPEYVLTKRDSEPMDDSLRCSRTEKTFNLMLDVHFQKYAIESIVSASKSKLNMILPERDAVLSYIGTIINEINGDLIRLGVQIAVLLKRYKTEDFVDTNSFDLSCEIKDPVSDRLDESHNQLKDVYQDNMGLHLFVWTCPQDNKDFLTVKINENDRCGRSIGVLWQGIELTRVNIKSSIMQAITNIPNLYLDGKLPTARVVSHVCKFVGDCIGSEPGVVGFKSQALIQLIHAIPDNSHED